MKKEDINLSDILQNVADSSLKSEHLLSNMNIEDMVSLANPNDNTLKIFSENGDETLKLSLNDGWVEGESESGWQTYSASHDEDNITLLLKGISVEFN